MAVKLTGTRRDIWDSKIIAYLYDKTGIKKQLCYSDDIKILSKLGVTFEQKGTLDLLLGPGEKITLTVCFERETEEMLFRLKYL